MDGFFVYVASLLDEIRQGESENLSNWKNEIKSWTFWRAVLAEFVATLSLLFIGLLSTVDLDAPGVTGAKDDGTDFNSKYVREALAYGLMYTVCIQMVGHVSGAHMNPAVTVGMGVVQAVSIPRAIFYCIAQCLGSVLGGTLVKGLMSKDYTSDIGLTMVAEPELTISNGFAFELLATFFVVLAIFGCTDSNRPLFGSPAIGIGFAYAAISLAGLPFTGASMNPARTLGASMASTDDSMRGYWIYWVGPILGSVVASLLYTMVFNPYKNTMSYSEAANELMRSEDTIGIPRDFFTSGPLSQVIHEEKLQTK